MPFRPKTGQRLKNLEIAVGIKEPQRTSIYDIVVSNLKNIGRTNFLHRLIFIAQHNYPKSDEVGIKFDEKVNMLNTLIFDEKLSGFLLVYPKYIAAVMEGSEYGLNLFLSSFIKGEFGTFSNAKILNFFTNINSRLLNTFDLLITTPTSLVDKIDTNSDMKASFNFSQQCSRKLHELIKLFVKLSQNTDIVEERETVNEGVKDEAEHIEDENNDDDDDDNDDVDDDDDVVADNEVSEITSKPASKQSITLSAITLDPSIKFYREYLPENDLLEFLVVNRYLTSLEKFYEMSSEPIPELQVFDNIYPKRHPIMVPDIFEVPYNPPCELPMAQADVVTEIGEGSVAQTTASQSIFEMN